METLAVSPKQSTFTKSIKLPLDTTKALERFAEQENRSVHYLLVTAVQEFIERKQDEANYQEYIKNRVLASEKRLDQQGGDGLTREQVTQNVMNFLDNLN